MNHLEQAILKEAALVKTLASLLPHNSQTDIHQLQFRIADLDAALSQIELQIQTARSLVAAERESLAQNSKVVEAAIDEQQMMLEHAMANLPKHLPKVTKKGTKVNENIGGGGGGNGRANSPIEERQKRVALKNSARMNLAGSDGISKDKENVDGAKKAVKKKTMQESIPAESGTTSVAYLTMNEYDMVPKYMVGRLTRDKINDLITEFNKIVESKTSILRLQPTKMNKHDRDRYYENQQLSNSEVKGKTFITEKDIKEYAQGSHFKLDPSGRAVIGILRHLNRVKEVRGGGVVRFLLL
ncbi:hypothetical protein SmJEL517_g04520 [Synchytrium microbalum]|uniref:Spindle and kinetochore-associated protein 1 n=1 Tax=Synchytrium microbalum TaxID=1806994 RepID=A0A507C2P7_9FUNG|nr:uncharacterized protein SmJEL517_g04520 [Synchytrium microbalum]TPX32354.1 hypothetical protein SmJEL517_g04520 [Synchytrium microbalum]